MYTLIKPPGILYRWLLDISLPNGPFPIPSRIPICYISHPWMKAVPCRSIFGSMRGVKRLKMGRGGFNERTKAQR